MFSEVHRGIPWRGVLWSGAMKGGSVKRGTMNGVLWRGCCEGGFHEGELHEGGCVLWRGIPWNGGAMKGAVCCEGGSMKGCHERGSMKGCCEGGAINKQAVCILLESFTFGFRINWYVQPGVFGKTRIALICGVSVKILLLKSHRIPYSWQKIPPPPLMKLWFWASQEYPTSQNWDFSWRTWRLCFWAFQECLHYT